jgi:WD40 repeat protein
LSATPLSNDPNEVENFMPHPEHKAAEPAAEAVTLAPQPLDPMAPPILAPVSFVSHTGSGTPPGAGMPQVPGYEVLGELGRGGMGVVYQARQKGLNRLVALKMILGGAHAGGQDLARFRAEAEAVAKLQHPNIVQIHEVGEVDGLPFFSLEYVDGGALDKRINGTPQPARQSAELIETLARAVHYAHERGIVHRDLKPANILLPRADKDTEGGWPACSSAKITDFGLAKRLDSQAGQTASGAIVGTPSYMAPEQAGGQKQQVGPAADVYALGAILYELLTGRPPFRAETPLDTVLQVLTDEPVPPTRLQPKVPRDLETIALKCLRKEIGQRYASAGELADDLRRFLNDEPIRARPLGVIARSWRWCRRRPVVAGLSAAVVLLVLLVASAAPLVAVKQASLRHQAEQKQQEAERAQEEAEHKRQVAVEARAELTQQKDQAVRELYARTTALAYQEWQANNVSRAERLLDSTPDRFRDWEWGYLKQLFHAELLTLHGHAGLPWRLALDPAGKRLVSLGRNDHMVYIWDTGTGQIVGSRPMDALAVSADGSLLAHRTDREPQKVQVVRAATGEPMRTLPGHVGQTSYAAFSHDRQRLATVGTDQSVRIWDVATGKELLKIHEPFRRLLHDLAFSPDGKRLAWKTAEGWLAVYDAASGKQLYHHREDLGGTIPWVRPAFSPDGSRLASPGFDGHVRLYETSSGKLLATLRGHRSFVFAVAFSPDGRRLASAGFDKTARVWDTDEAREILTLRGHNHFVVDVVFSADGRRLATSSSDTTIKIWDAPPGPASDGKDAPPRDSVGPVHDPMPEYVTLAGHTGAVECIAFSPDGSRLASAGWDGTVRVYDLATTRAVQTWREAGYPFGGVAYSPDGKLLAYGTGGTKGYAAGKIFLRQAQTGKLVRTLVGHTTPVAAVAFTPDGGRLVSVGGSEVAWQKGEVKIWDVKTGQVVLNPEGHALAVRSLAVSPDGKWFATSGNDSQVRLWDLATGKEVRRLGEVDPLFLGLAFSRDGRRLAAGANDRLAAGPIHPSVRVWDVATGKELARCHGHTRELFGLAFSPNDRRLVSASLDMTVKVWDPETGQELLTLPGHRSEVYGVTFSPDGRLLASCGYDCAIHVRGTATAIPVSTDDWPVIFADKFERTELGPRWQPVKGTWSVEADRLKGVLAHTPIPPVLPEFNSALILPRDLPMPSTVEVRFDCWTADEVNCEVKFHDADLANGLCTMLMGNPTAFSSGEKGSLIIVESMGGYRTVADNTTVTLEPNRHYRVRVLREPERLSVFVDGRPVITHPVPRLDVPFLHLQGSFGKAGGVIYFDNVEVRAPEHTAGERRALAVVERLFEAGSTKEEVLAQLAKEPGLAEAERRLALEIAGRRIQSPQWLNTMAWGIVTRRDASAPEYKWALRQAGAAARLAPAEMAVLNTLGVAQYRAGNYQGARHSLAKCLEADLAGAGQYGPINLAFMALVEHRLDNHEAALLWLDRLAERMLQDNHAADAELQGFYREALERIGADVAEQRQRTIRNLRAIADVMHKYHEAHGRFPAAALSSADGKPLLSWRVALLPYLGEEVLYKEFKVDEPWDGPHNRKLLGRMPAVYQTRTGEGVAQDATFLQVFTGPGTVFEGDRGIALNDITDGTKDTLLTVEAGQAVPWTQPADQLYRPEGPIAPLGAGPTRRWSFVRCDASVDTTTRDAPPALLRALITRNGKESVAGQKLPR